MSEFKFSKADAKKFLAGAMAFAVTLTSLSVTPLSVLASEEGPVVTSGEITPGEVTPGEVTPGEVTPGEVTPGEVPSSRFFSILNGAETERIEYGRLAYFGLDISLFEGEWNAEDWSITWYQRAEGADIEVQPEADDVTCLSVRATSPREVYYAVVSYDNGTDQETLTSADFTVEVESWHLRIDPKTPFISVARGGSFSFEPAIECDIPSSDENFNISYEWAIMDEDAMEYIPVGSDLSYSEAPVYYEEQYGYTRCYELTVVTTYGEEEQTCVEQFGVEITADGINTYSDSDDIQIITEKNKSVTLSAKATSQTTRTMNGIWYKDGAYYATAGTGNKNKPIVSTITVTEPGTYEFSATTSRSESGLRFSVYSTNGATKLTTNKIEGSIDSDDCEYLEVFEFSPKYSGTIKVVNTMTSTHKNEGAYGRIQAFVYDEEGVELNSMANSMDEEGESPWYVDSLRADKKYYIVAISEIDEIDSYAPAEVANNEADFEISLEQEYVCYHYNAMGINVPGFYENTDKDQEWLDDSTELVGYKKATTSANGYTGDTQCKDCGEIIKKGAVIYAAKSVTLSATSYTYDGKEKKPTVTVKNSKGSTIASTDYTVAYTNNKKVGTATVTITLKGDYAGKLTATFAINPKGTTIKSVTAASKGFKVTLNKNATETTGYEIQYATASSFSGAKTVKITKNSTLTASVSKLTASKKYYVRVRTYKTVGGKTYYSAWSAAKTVTTKK